MEEPREYKSLKIYDTTHDDLTRLIAIRTLKKGKSIRIVHLLDELISNALEVEEEEIEAVGE